MTNRLIALAALAVVLQGCASQSPPQIAGENINIGIAKSCTFTPVDPGMGGSATITMTNDGWCAVRTTEKDGQPYQLGLLKQRPEHGRVLIQKIGGQTRAEYTADPGWTGTDKFAVALRPRATGAADVTLQVTVTVSRGEGVAPPSAAAPAAAAPAAAPSRGGSRTGTRTPAR